MARQMTLARRQRLEKVSSQRQFDLTLVLANIHDPHNVSAIYRSCDAFGLALVNLYYSDTAFPELGRKTSASAKKWVKTKRHENKAELWQYLQAQGMQILATACTDTAKSLYDWDLTKPSAIILGNEHAGVAEDLIESADGLLYIPMRGMIQSFNVSVAAGVILAEAARQRALAGLYREPRNLEARQNLLEEWLATK